MNVPLEPPWNYNLNGKIHSLSFIYYGIEHSAYLKEGEMSTCLIMNLYPYDLELFPIL